MDPIAPISAAIDKTEELLGHSPHPAIVTVPLGAWTVSTVCDSLAMITGERAYDDAARVSMGVGLVGASIAAVTGIRDYAAIPTDRPSHRVATAHALGNAVVGTLFATSYLCRVADHQRGRQTSTFARLLGMGGAALSLYTAWLGGVLVEEQGEGVKPVMEHSDGRHGAGQSAAGASRR